MPHQFEVLLDGFGRQRVLAEDQVLVLPAAVHFRHHQVRQEVLKGKQMPPSADRAATLTWVSDSTAPPARFCDRFLQVHVPREVSADFQDMSLSMLH